MILKFFAFLLFAGLILLLVGRVNRIAKNKKSTFEDAIDISQLKNPSVLLKLPGIRKNVDKTLQKTDIEVENFIDRD